MNRLLRSDKKLLQTARLELNRLPFGKEALRLRAITALHDNPAQTVAKMFGCSVGTLRNWVLRFASEGVKGLTDKKKKPRRSKLNRSQTDEILRLVDTSSKRWTLLALRNEIKRRFDIDISLNGVWKMLRRENYAHVSARPVHHKQKKGGVKAF